MNHALPDLDLTGIRRRFEFETFYEKTGSTWDEQPDLPIAAGQPNPFQPTWSAAPTRQTNLTNDY